MLASERSFRSRSGLLVAGATGSNPLYRGCRSIGFRSCVLTRKKIFKLGSRRPIAKGSLKQLSLPKGSALASLEPASTNGFASRRTALLKLRSGNKICWYYCCYTQWFFLLLTGRAYLPFPIALFIGTHCVVELPSAVDEHAALLVACPEESA
jgi:hypothetical protein